MLQRTLPGTASPRRHNRHVASVAKCLSRASVIAILAATSAGTVTNAGQRPTVLASLDGPPLTVDDPWARLNRKTFQLNTGLDDNLFAPLTHAYVRAVPVPMRDGLSSAVSNLREPRTALNDLAQGHFRRAGVSASRFAVNSTVGLLGVFDFATRAGLAGHRADFGQTLGRYGVQPGPFLVLPILGPYNVRDGLGRLIDAATDPVALIAGGGSSAFGVTRRTASAIVYRANAEPAFRALADATDPYVTMRSAYGQRRAFLVREATGEAEALPNFDDETGYP